MKVGIEELDKLLEDEENKSAFEKWLNEREEPLKNKRDDLLSKLASKNKVLDSLDEYGGVDSILKKLKELEQKSMDKAKESGDAEKIIEQYEERLRQKDEKISKMEKATVDSEVKSLVDKSIRDAKGIPELLQPVVSGRIKAEMVDGQVKITVLNPNGETYLKDGNPVTVSQLVSEMKEQETYQRAFEGTGSSGTGGSNANSGNGKAPIDNPFAANDKGERPHIQQAMELYRQDPIKGKQLAEEAGFPLQE